MPQDDRADNAVQCLETNSLIPAALLSQKCCLLGFRFKMKARKEYFSETLCHSWKEFSISAMSFFCFTRGPSKICWECWK